MCKKHYKSALPPTKISLEVRSYSYAKKNKFHLTLLSLIIPKILAHNIIQFQIQFLLWLTALSD